MVRNGPVRSEQVCDADDQNSSGCKEQNLGGVNSSKHGHFSSAHPHDTCDCNNGKTVSANRIIVPKRAASDWPRPPFCRHESVTNCNGEIFRSKQSKGIAGSPGNS